MKIFVVSDDKEHGPYSRSEVFALMRDGVFDPDTLGRWENETELKSVNSLLASGAIGFFSAEQIAKQQDERPPAPIIIPDFTPARRDEVDIQERPNRKKLQIFGAIAVVLIGCMTFLLLRASHEDKQGPNDASEVNTSTLPIASQIATSVQTKRSSSGTEKGLISKPEDSPILRSIDLRNKNTPGQSKDRVTESLPHLEPPPTAVDLQTQPPAISASVNQFPIAEGASERIQKVELPTISGVTASSMHIVQFGKKPQAVLLICLDRSENTENVANETPWKNFASEHNLLLAVAMFSFSDSEKDKRPFVLSSSLMRIALHNGLKSSGFSNLPILLYGRGLGGTLTSTFANENEREIMVWSAYTDNPQMSQLRSDDRPALIMSNYENPKKSELRKFFEEGRNSDKRWTWIDLVTPEKERRARAEEFVRAYFSSLLNRRSGDDYWVEIDDLTEVSPTYVMSFPKIAVWLPTSDLASVWKSLMPQPGQKLDPVIIRRKIKTFYAGQPELEMVLRLPPGSSKQNPPAGTFAFCTWESNADIIAEQLRFRPNMKSVAQGGPVWIANNIIKYAEEHNLAVLSWTTRQVWSLKGSSEDLDRKTQVAFDVDFGKVCAAWEKGVLFFEKQYQMPSTNMLGYGMSRGGQWMHRLVLAHPSRFLAAHVHVSSTYGIPTPSANSVLWLVTTGEQERGYEKAIRFYTECRTLGYPMMFKAFIGLGHGDNPRAWNIGLRFFDYALSFRNAQMKSQREKPTLQPSFIPPWTDSYQYPPYVGNLINQKIYPLSEVNMIPVALRVPLPTKQLADLWKEPDKPK